jgi:thiol-disulfide isomerase/thioredoxin
MSQRVYALGLIMFVLAICSYSAPMQEAPDFVVYDTNGKRHVLYDMLAKLPQSGLFVINFTSIHCKPCKKEIPELSGIVAKAGSTANLICIYSETGEPVKKLAEELDVADRAYVDPFGNIQKLYGVKKIPVTVIIGKNHRIQGRFEGYSTTNIKQIEKIVLAH